MDMMKINTSQVRKLSYGQLKSWYCGLVKRPPLNPPYIHVNQIGDPILRQQADPVPSNLIGSPELNLLIKRMKYVLNKYDCVGLSAPQIGISQRVFLMEFNKKHMKSFSPKEQAAREMTLFPFKVCKTDFISI